MQILTQLEINMEGKHLRIGGKTGEYWQVTHLTTFKIVENFVGLNPMIVSVCSSLRWPSKSKGQRMHFLSTYISNVCTNLKCCSHLEANVKARYLSRGHAKILKFVAEIYLATSLLPQKVVDSNSNWNQHASSAECVTFLKVLSFRCNNWESHLLCQGRLKSGN